MTIKFSKEQIQKLKDKIKSEIIAELDSRKLRLDNSDVDYIVGKVQARVTVKEPKIDSKEVLVGLLNQITKSEEEKHLAFNKEKILTKEVRTDFINDILNQIRVPKDGKPGLKGESGKDGKDYKLTRQDRIDIGKTIEGVVTTDVFNQRYLQLVKDIKSGKIKLPAHGGINEQEIIKKINKGLDTTDWQNGLPGDGELGGNLEWIDLTDEPTDVPSGAGVMSWNMEEICLDVQTGIGPTLQVGQEIYILIYNDIASPITNGTVLRPKAATPVGDLIIPTVEKANASVFSTVEGTIMMATMNIPVGEIGLATRFGRVRGIDTDGETPGVNVYIGTTDGEWTTSEPEFPNYGISIGGIIKVDDTDGEIFFSVTRDFSDTVLNFWNGTFRETFKFLVTSTGGVITGSLSPANGHPDMTMRFSDGYTMLDTDPAKTIVLTAGTSTVPEQNFVYIPKSTKVLTMATSGWPATEHIKVSTVLLRTATITENEGALKNHNWNDHIEDTFSFQGHLPHITEKLRQFEAQWDSGTEGTATGFPSNVYFHATAGVVYQLHRQTFPAQTMPTDDVHVVNNFASPYVTVSNLNTQTLDALGNTLANSSFSFVLWGVQNKTGELSHLMCNLPTANYSKNSPASAVADALNYSVYTIPTLFKGTGFLIARFTMVLEAGGTTWSLFDTEDLRGRVPNSSAGGGAGGGGVTTWTALSDTPAAYAASQIPRSNAGGTALDFTTLLPSGATQVAAGASAGEFWRTSGHATLPDNVILQGV